MPQEWRRSVLMPIGWSKNNFFFEIEKKVVLKTCQTGKIYEKNWFWRVATFGGLATPQNVFRGVKFPKNVVTQ